MTDQTNDPTKIVLSVPVKKELQATLPGLLKTDTRSTGAGEDLFVNDTVVQVAASFDLSAIHRSTGEEATVSPEPNQLLALEAEDGTTIFVRADKLQEDLQRIHPRAIKEGKIDLAALAGHEAAPRGLEDWLWSKLSILTLGRDSITETAERTAREWLKDRLKAKFTDEVEKAGLLSASWIGAKALMWAIESQLSGDPGLYRWGGEELKTADRVDKDDDDLAAAAKKSMLVFIHGTGSHTLGAFKDLGRAGSASDWSLLTAQFEDRIFGFEHRTFSESPIDNALMLAETLPEKAKISLVTHSRGGLVGDLLCLDDLSEKLVKAYRRDPLPRRTEKPWEKLIRQKAATEEQEKLRELNKLLKEKKFNIERYVRVACPAGGTTLLSDNLDLFLSGLLSLTNTLVGAVLGPGASPVLSAFKRIVLEIADKRMDPWLVPGIEAMLTDAPLVTLLARAPRKAGIAMGVIAGDIEGGGLLQRIGVMFTDWMFFDRVDNDLVVDTASMYAGPARAPKTWYLFDQGERVNHFSYFQNRRTLRGLQEWIETDRDQLPELHDWTPIRVLGEPGRKTVKRASEKHAGDRGEPTPGSQPVAIILPDFMGSHLEVRNSDSHGNGKRVWFNPSDIAEGGIKEIRINAPDVKPEGFFEIFYGKLAAYLENTHRVIPYPYDWRQTIQEAATGLAEKAKKTLDEHPNQPIRFLAHGMGGLVARAMIANNEKLWNRIVKRGGGRLVMMGTPNNGSHLMVETLLGKSGAIRKLAVIDTHHKMQGLLDIVAGFPGTLQLLPRSGFQDTGNTRDDYYLQASWNDLQQHNRDWWFGNGICGLPTQSVLDEARKLWEGGVTQTRASGEGWRHRPISPVDSVAYIYGQAENTPCGVRVEGNRLKMVGTSEGDGSATWASARLDFLPENRCWYMPVDHGRLTKTKSYFPAILELLEMGKTSRLGRLPATRGAAATRTYDAGPVLYPTKEDIEHSLMGTRPILRKTPSLKRTLKVGVRAMDLRHTQIPMMCGHYIGDPIAGAEAAIDKHLVAKKLRHRERLGVYADDIGTTALVIDFERRAGQNHHVGKGAIILGLGEWDKLTPSKLTETVRDGVLRYLFLVTDQCRQDSGTSIDTNLKLGSVLIGYNSTVNIGIEDSVSAIVRGVCEANHRFEDTVGSVLRVCELEFIELFLDTAISAAKVVRDLPTRLESDLKRLEMDIQPKKTLIRGEGYRMRLSVSGGFGYWPRLVVTDADRPDIECPPECYQIRRVSPIPAHFERQLCEELADDLKSDEDDTASPRKKPSDPSPPVVSDRMKFVFLSQRARAEAILYQRQPGLAEKMIRHAIAHRSFSPDLAHTLFQLLVPVDFKEAARNASQMILVLDHYTANIPWEMLCAEQDEPLVVKTALVRQLESTRFRKSVHAVTRKTACVIADPLTAGFEKYFKTRSGEPLSELSGAREEGRLVRNILTEAGYSVVYAPNGTEASDVFNRLFKTPCRILVIAGHGVFEEERLSGGRRSGVVLSDGMLLTAAEIGQMEIVPEVVFLNCCHLGKINVMTPFNRLAYSISRELIEMGVRCIVAAGWAVNDLAAKTFAETFFESLVKRGESFGRAIHKARRETYEAHKTSNTWGAYQAYGDPQFRLEHHRRHPKTEPGELVAPQELIESLNWIRNDLKFHDHQSLAKVRSRVESEITRGDKVWVNQPPVQVAIGKIYAELGIKGFELARTAYLKAIAEEDKAGVTPIKTIEQLANLEARSAEKLENTKEGMDLVWQAIKRIENLLGATAERPVKRKPAQKLAEIEGLKRQNLERWAILGSAFKHKAALEYKRDWAPSTLRKTLKASRDAYKKGEGQPTDEGFNPYAMINRLQLDALLSKEDRDDRIGLARQCRSAAKKRFKERYDFFDAVMRIDAKVAEELLNNKLVAARDQLVEDFKDAFAKVPASEKEHDSVIKQLILMGDFFGKLSSQAKNSRQEKAMRSTGKSLHYIAEGLGVSTSSDDSAQATKTTTEPESEDPSKTKAQKGKTAKAIGARPKKPKSPRSRKSAK